MYRAPKYPVTGVRVEEAGTYLAERQKRLPTIAEWMRASSVDNQRWAFDLVQAWVKHIYPAMNAYIEFKRMPMIPKVTGRPPGEQRMREQRWENARVEMLNKLRQTLIYSGVVVPDWCPLLLQSVSERTDDHSVFGMNDALMNPVEMGLPRNRTSPTLVKLYAASLDPFVSYIAYRDTEEGHIKTFHEMFIFNGGGDLEVSTFEFYSVLPALITMINARGFASGAVGSSASVQTNNGQTTISPANIIQMRMDWVKQALPGFRGVR
jgi:hypothetical protein